MTISSIGLTQQAYALATVIGANALGHFKANTVAARLAQRYWEPLAGEKGSTIRVPKRGSLTAYAKAAATAVTLNQVSVDKIDITLNQHWEVSFLIEDVARALTNPDYVSGYTEDGAKVLGEKVDGALLALYSGLSQTIDATGSAGPLSEEDFVEAGRLLNAAKAPLRDRVAILHEDAAAEALAIEELINRAYSTQPGGMPNGQADAYLGKLKGFDVYMDQTVTTTGSQCKNVFMHPYALALATRPLSQVPDGLGVIQRVIDEDGVGIRVTISYDADYLGVKCTLDTLYGVAEGIDAFGVAVSTDEA